MIILKQTSDMSYNLRTITIALILILLSALLYRCNTPAKVPQVAAPVADTTAIAIADTVAAQTPLTLVITNLASATAPVVVTVYKPNSDFLKPKAHFKKYTFKTNGKALTTQLTDLKFGDYAIVIYQDINSSGKIDKNLVGIPTEGYAFSNNFKPKVKAPSFDDCKFAYSNNSNSVSMSMIQ